MSTRWYLIVKFFNRISLHTLRDKLVTTVISDDCSRLILYSQWYLETGSLLTEEDLSYLSKDRKVIVGLLGKIGLDDLEFLSKDVKQVGAKLTYARLLEAAFQYFLKMGDAYQTVCWMKQPSWTNVYFILRDQNWNPFS